MSTKIVCTDKIKVDKWLTKRTKEDGGILDGN